MLSRTDDVPQEAETRENKVEESLEISSVNSATSTRQQESIQTASPPANQSNSAEGFSTSPSKPTASVDLTSALTARTQAHQRTTSSPSSLQAPAPTPSLLTARGPYFSSQPAASGIEARSPAKRDPASRSSHGIPTAHGPPPALITQRSYHAEPWRTSAAADSPKRPTASPHKPQSHSGGTTLDRRNSLDSRTSSKTRLNQMNGGLEKHGPTPNPSFRQPDEQEGDDETLRLGHGAGAKGQNTSNGIRSAVGQEDDQTYSSNEDLFLHLAHAESEAGNASDTASRTGRRGSHMSLSTSRSVRTSRPLNSRPTSGARAFAEGAPVDQLSRWARSDPSDKPINGPYSSPRDRSYVASAHPLEPRQNRYLHSELSSKTSPRLRNGSNKDRSAELVGSHGRRQSIESVSAIPYRGSKQSVRPWLADTPNDTSPITSHTPTGQSFDPDGTESPASTTAPSTVWDELDDLKSRIRNLELTGKLPSPSGAAIIGNASGRPRTATTTMTTASLSPNHNRNNNISNEASTVTDTHKSGLHPLLHSALAKARTLVEPKAFKALETTASDALDLTAIAQGNPHQRPLRRKADNMCRSLTELCIALSEERTSAETAPSIHLPKSPSAKDSTIRLLAAEDGHNHRATSQEPDRPSSRIMSRLEARRTSLLASSAASSPQNQPSTQEFTTIIHQDSSTPQRPPSVVFHRRRTADGASFPTLASINNANTIQHSRSGSRGPEQRPSPISRISREYTSQHPLPTLASNHQRSPSVQSALPSSARRSYFPTSASNSPHTPIMGAVQPGSRRYVSASQPGSAEVQRQQRIASLGQFSSGSRRLRLVDGEGG
ncbi:MAG: hypothetical protein LQ352_002076 [Teloschistes flavicans]|nr:MAG: hypothetical protein LQ352_002076 [Teloschistes flavicans]